MSSTTFDTGNCIEELDLYLKNTSVFFVAMSCSHVFLLT